MAGNQLGKTFCGAAEVALHLTGQYPDWWTGRRWTRPVRCWAGSNTGEVTRDGPQRYLIGEPKDRGQWGKGMIPGDLLGRVTMRQGAPDAVDTILVQHVSGNNSTLGFKSYDQGRMKWQGETLDVVWYDEEPPQDIYTEGLTRTNATGGMAFLTFTPLLGMSEVVRTFIVGTDAVRRHVTSMTIEDAEHLTPEQREQIIQSYPEHERAARTRGIPTLGSGRIFPVADEAITVAPFEIPPHYACIGGLDLGWDHPTAAVKLAHDRDADIIYLTQVYRVREQTPLIHASALKPWGDQMPWAWPHDAYQRDKNGQQFRDIYEGHGLKMLPSHASFEDGSNSVEAGVQDLLERMQTRRLKVFSNCADWFEEFRLYHRKDGVIVKAYDDLMDATRYALMSLRFATAQRRRKPIDRYREADSELTAYSWMAV